MASPINMSHSKHGLDETSPEPSQITCAAFRAAFVTTLDSLLRYSLDPSAANERPDGIFDCFPMLNAVAPQIQLECLLRTWNRVRQGLTDSANVLDDCVLHAAREALARLSTDANGARLRVVLNGPQAPALVANHWICSQTRCLQAAGPKPLHAAFLREFTAIDEVSSRMGTESGEDADLVREDLLSLLGRWMADREIVFGSHGLLTQAEQDILQVFFEEHPGLIR